MDTARLSAALPDDPAEIASLLQHFSCLVLLTCSVVFDLTEYQLVTYAGKPTVWQKKGSKTGFLCQMAMPELLKQDLMTPPYGPMEIDCPSSSSATLVSLVSCVAACVSGCVP